VKLVFAEVGWEDYLHWQARDRTILARVNTLIAECKRSPFKGTGKPEPLKQDFAGWWSRRITEEHRLVYRITGKAPDQALEIAQCRYHYGGGQGRRH
jgi:toxin YoeB